MPIDEARAQAFHTVPSPCFVLDEVLLESNLRIIADVQRRAGCSIIAALKSAACWHAFPLMRQFLPGMTASSLNEARLAHESFGGHLHVYAPAFHEDELPELLSLATHVTFNSFGQWRRARPLVQAMADPPSCGIRVNPGHSESVCHLYDPCAPGSRLGVAREEFRPDELDGIEGLHVHALCDQGPDSLGRLIPHVERLYGEFLPRMRWVNLGGGHLIPRKGYDVDLLVETIRAFRQKWGVEVILEPGSGIVHDAGFLVTTVLDVVRNGMDVAILDCSATAHMPEVVETPFRPRIQGAGDPGEKPFLVRLGGASCLSGDVLGDYSFDAPLKLGDRLVVEDQARYTMVRTTMFNGLKHPAIALLGADGQARIVREFGFQDYKSRMG